MATARSLAALPSAGAPCSGPRRAGAWPPRVVAAAAEPEHARRLVAEFDPAVPLEAAVTPPSGWYTDADFLRLEIDRVFFRGWQAVGHIWQVENPHDFFTGRLGNVEFVICRDANGNLNAFHNVCRHHASLLACGSGQKTCFQCPYHTYERVSVQRCESAPSESDDLERLGTKALYAFVYPNFMINRYGPWMDTNLAVPLGSTKCKDDQNFLERSLRDSEQVQMEDIALCEGVQRGLESPAYSTGRYAPSVEMAMHHFHCLLHSNLSS